MEADIHRNISGQANDASCIPCNTFVLRNETQDWLKEAFSIRLRVSASCKLRQCDHYELCFWSTHPILVQNLYQVRPNIEAERTLQGVVPSAANNLRNSV